ncbi:helix-turn-helix transcriptional regulator [Pseudonocardia asaccharolytica]|uniref:HTH luxR-type domain-containing protein n=1 Tax=Pseudonocardia asaccharolytica DSM 44247 = NBRC 16224 TaxID=1123024 RepID=A0A511CV91_9PSEU|nr:LuxR C-terminal-related transcriptional regulator [Pseudonocardia asaccharolytica]GEL16495.1 hypothetical protein PA7_03320 [Pseudonocardia asaccharolytica DSM 44247 = NBRC 16224]
MQDAMTLAMSLAAAAHGPVTREEAAAEVLGELCARAPVVAATVVAFDPIVREHVPLCVTGYPTDVLDFLCSPAFLRDDVGYRLLVTRPERRARCWRDIDVDYTRTPSVIQVFQPAGYAGGATARLTTRDGRYTGDLHLSTTDPDLPTPPMMAALHHLAPLLASVTDVTRRISLLLDDLERDATAAVVSDQAVVVPLPDRDVPVPLDRDPDLVRRVTAWRGGPDAVAEARFLHRTGDRWHRVRLVKIAGGTLVVLRETPPPYGLTARELQVLTLLSAGLLNVAIAHRLGISERTAAHHVEHVLAKLGASSRTAAARGAVEEGLRLLP